MSVIKKSLELTNGRDGYEVRIFEKKRTIPFPTRTGLKRATIDVAQAIADRYPDIEGRTPQCKVYIPSKVAFWLIAEGTLEPKHIENAKEKGGCIYLHNVTLFVNGCEQNYTFIITER